MPLNATFEQDLRGGVVVLRGRDAPQAPGAEWQATLYRTARQPPEAPFALLARCGILAPGADIAGRR